MADKIIKRYIEQELIGYTKDSVKLRCIIEYTDGSVETVIETRNKQKGFLK